MGQDAVPVRLPCECREDVPPAARIPSPQGGRQDASQGSRGETQVRARTPQAKDGRTPGDGPMSKMRPEKPRARAKSLRGLPRKRTQVRTRPLRQEQGCRRILRWPKARKPTTDGAGEEQEAKVRTHRSRVMRPLRRASSSGEQRRLRDLPGGEARGREGTLRRQEGERPLRPVRCGSRRQRFDVRLVRRKGHETPSAQERREPGEISCTARPRGVC